MKYYYFAPELDRDSSRNSLTLLVFIQGMKQLEGVTEMKGQSVAYWRAHATSCLGITCH